MPDGESDLCDSIVHALSGLEPGPSLDGAAARWLEERSDEDAARVIAALVARALLGPAERKAQEGVARALLWGPPTLVARREPIRAAAAALGFGPLWTLLTDAAPERVMDPDSRRIDPVLAPMTLGHRTQLARRETDRDRLSRLALDDDPAVIRNLLVNPRLTEALLLRIASRRPVPAEVLVEIARARRWCARHAVRRSLMLNPYTPPLVVNQILPGLPEADLREAMESEVLHPSVRRTAVAILADRGAAWSSG